VVVVVLEIQALWAQVVPEAQVVAEQVVVP
jgi:hypothetical protein